MTPCPTCGAERGNAILWDGIVASDKPYAIFWMGLRLPLTPADAQVAYLLIQYKTISDDRIIENAPNGGTSGKVASVRMGKVRKAFEAAGVPLRITRIEGYGYKVEKA